MDPQIEYRPAASFSLDALGEIFTSAFEGYFYASTVTGAMLAARVRAEQIDLARSLVLMVGAAPAGIALVALRAERAWCGGFGVAAAFRGRGLAHQLAAAMIEQGRQAGASEFSLEVLTRNAPAIATYQRAGMRARRDVRVLEWHRDTAASAVPDLPGLAPAEWAPRRLLAHFDALHPVPAAWQRDLPALLTRAGLQGLALADGDRPRAYLLYSLDAEGRARVADLAAADAEQARALLAELQRRAQHILSVNEPADSPATAAFDALGFAESDRQHELAIQL
jgi:GNAT superfamily N-acetyltransferase